MLFQLASLFFLALALGLVAWIARRAVLARRAPPPVEAEVERIKRQLAVLKVLHADGKVTDYEHRRHALAAQLVELGRAKSSSQPAKPTTLVLGALAGASATLGIGALLWHLQMPSTTEADAPGTAAISLSADRLEHAVVQSRQRVAADPKDAAAWAMLAHSYDMLGRPAEASAAWVKLLELRPGDAQVLADAADSMALARGRNFEGEPMRLIHRALELDPDNLKALSLAGAEAFGRNDAAQAIAYWQRARKQVSDATLSRQLDNRIAEAQALKERASTAGTAPLPAGATPGARASIKGRVVLADRLKTKVSGNDALFVFARPADGSRMPVALMRRRAGDLPIEFELDDSMAMVPEARLSQQTRVLVGARISKRGDATPTAGDLQGFSVPVTVGTQGLQIEISEVVQ